MSIAREIAAAAYLEDLMVCKPNSAERDQVCMFVEMAEKLNTVDLGNFINDHMAMKMFLVGKSISVADIFVFAALAHHWSQMEDKSKVALPNTFRWLDHIQHLPGIWDQVQEAQLATSFPGPIKELSAKELQKQKKKDEAQKKKESAKGHEAKKAPEEKKNPEEGEKKPK